MTSGVARNSSREGFSNFLYGKVLGGEDFQAFSGKTLAN